MLVVEVVVVVVMVVVSAVVVVVVVGPGGPPFTAGVQDSRARRRVTVRVPNWSVTSVSGGDGAGHRIL